MPISLRRLVFGASFVGCADLCVTELVDHSEACRTGSVFAAIAGTKVDGAKFVSQAIARGAKGIIASRPVSNAPVPQCIVPDVRHAYALAHQALQANPANDLRIAGVTGTNGKSTTTWMIRSILQTNGLTCGLLGTIEYCDGKRAELSKMTTPDAPQSASWFRRMADADTKYAAIEVSSHALDQSRLAGVKLDAAVVTNITQDHFDYHGNFENYFASKCRIRDSIKSGGLLVLNDEDPTVLKMRIDARPDLNIRTIGFTSRADVWAQLQTESIAGSQFQLHCPQGSVSCSTSLIGRHNVFNAMAAAAICLEWGLSLEQIAAGIRLACRIPGRLERISSPAPFSVFVDYAHTDDALRRCLSGLTPLTPGRVICVFGAGGDRDRSKRPLLGAAACLADRAVVTSDNPRSEEPREIIHQIVSGMTSARVPPIIEPDREKAIRKAIELARSGDTIVIAGKGHEQEQIVGSSRSPFNDAVIARKYLAESPRSASEFSDRISA